MAKPTLIVFLGRIAGGYGEDLVGDSHVACALDLMERCREEGAFDRTILVTNVDQARLGTEGGFTLETSRDDFHFGECLKKVIGKYRIERPFYVGAGSAPLLTRSEIRDASERLASDDGIAVSNNLYSCDLLGFHPGRALDRVDLPASDNGLARLLVEQAGLKHVALPKTLSTQFDIDTPADLQILSALHGTGSRLSRLLSSAGLDTAKVGRVCRLFRDKTAEVLVAGRIGSSAWSRLETETACRFRVLSEERGMRSDGREEAGTVRSILGFHIEKVGARQFFQTLSRLGQAAVIDSRVIFNHFRLAPTRSDRFNSDLGRPDLIRDPFIAEFTREALAAPIPVLLGGHSIVSGGLLALIEIARRNENKEP